MSAQHSTSHTNHFGFSGHEHGLYDGNAHFGTSCDPTERRDYMAIDHPSPANSGRHTGSSYPHDFDYDHQHLAWELQSHGEIPFVHYSHSNNVFHTSYGLGVYDRAFASPLMQELLPPNPGAISLDGTLIHPSRSAPPSCASSPLVPSTFVDYLEVPTATNVSMSREQSPAQSENDPSDTRRKYPCLIEGCARRFTSQYTLRVHVEAHKPKPKQSFPCQLGCSERFSRQHDRLRHEVSKHGKICEFLCEDCGRFFSSRKTLGNHKCPVAYGTTRWMNS